MLDDKKTRIRQLLGRIKENDLLALGELMDIKTRDIEVIAFKILHDKSLAEDVVNEVMVSFVQNIHSFDDEQNLNGWINAVAINKSIDYKRKIINETELKFEGAIDTGGNNIESDIVERLNILDILQRLDDMERKVFIDKVINDLQFNKISEKHNITFKQVRRLYKSAKQKFIKLYKNNGCEQEK